jgi:hypothetical protein
MNWHDWPAGAARDTLGPTSAATCEMTGPRATAEAPPAFRRPSGLAVTLAALLLSACQAFAPPPPPPAAPTTSIAALYRRPAERSLVDGIRLYEEASFGRAEEALRQSLRQGLADPRDQAVAYKYIAFIACAFDRIAECESSFASAFAADPKFALGEKEVGHPVWGPVYRRVAAVQPK